jgi:hypothetical protein
VKSPALVAVDAAPESFAALFAAAAELGVRIGWLELAAPDAAPASLERAAGLGALRAVAAGGGRALALKPLRGEPVLRDLLREHFLGCAVVLVRGSAGYPRLAPSGERLRLELAPDRARELDPPAALALLARPGFRSHRSRRSQRGQPA